MASTNKTMNLGLSQFVGDDKPSWLTDYNSDMEKIDTKFGESGTSSAELEKKVGKNEKDIASLNTSVNALTLQATTQETQIDGLSTRMTAAEAKENDLQNSLDELTVEVAELHDAQDIIIVGDSYGTKTGNYVEKLRLLLPSRTIWNACVAGAGFTSKTSGGSRYLDNLQAKADEITASKVGMVFVIGGGNDFEKWETIPTEAAQLFTYIKATYPNAKIYCAYCWARNKGDFGSTEARVEGMYHNVAVNNAVTYLNGMWAVLHNTLQECVLAGDTHPSETGYQRLANWLYGVIQTGIASMTIGNVGAETLVKADGVTSITGHLYTQIINGLLKVTGQLVITFESVHTTNNFASRVKFATTPNPRICFMGENQTIPCANGNWVCTDKEGGWYVGGNMEDTNSITLIFLESMHGIGLV